MHVQACRRHIVVRARVIITAQLEAWQRETGISVDSDVLVIAGPHGGRRATVVDVKGHSRLVLAVYYPNRIERHVISAFQVAPAEPLAPPASPPVALDLTAVSGLA